MSWDNRQSAGTVSVAKRQVTDRLASVAGGHGVDAAHVADDCWSAIPAFGLVGSEDRKHVPTAAVDAFPMTRQQEVMATQMVLGGVLRRRRGRVIPAYHNVATSLHSLPRIDVESFVACGEAMTARHELFRSVLDMDRYSCPMQVVLKKSGRPLVDVYDLRGLPREAQRECRRRFTEGENAREIDLQDTPLIRYAIHIFDETRIALTITEPHAIADGWSTHLNLVEFFERYAATVTGHKPSEAALAERPLFHLRQHSAQQLWQLQSAEDSRWWQTYVDNPSFGPGAYETDDRYAWQEAIEVRADVIASLTRLGKQLRVGLKSTLLSVHLRALALLTNRQSAVTGVTVNTRQAVPGGVDARGMFLNVVPLYLHNPEVSAEFITGTNRELMQVTARGRYPLAQITRLAGRQAIPKSLFVFNSFHSIAGAADRLGIDTLEDVVDWSHTDFPFEASFNRSEELTDRMTLLLYSEGSPHKAITATAAYRRSLEDFATLGEKV